jgi:predicted transcriptional regulator YdeE
LKMERHEYTVFTLSKLNLDDIEKTFQEAYHQKGSGRPPARALINLLF